MHLHLPKPPHGWREFLSEVAVIVVGISIAIGAEQTVEWVHHRSEVHEATEKLRAESIANRDSLAFSLSILSNAIKQVDGQIAVLGDCESPFDQGKLAPVNDDQIAGPENTAWLGIRDGALLSLMPAELVGNYSKLEGIRGNEQRWNDQFKQTRDDASAVVDVLRAGSRDHQVCIDAAIKLRKLKRIELQLWANTQFYQMANEMVLQGEVLNVGSIREIGRKLTPPDRGQD